MVGTLIHSTRRRTRELALAYRIATTRVRKPADRQHLARYERTVEQLVARLAKLAAESAADAPRATTEWLGVGTARQDCVVFQTMQQLEEKVAAEIAALKSHVSRDARPALECALCGSEARQHWLRSRAAEA